MLAAAFNANGMLWKTSPAATELEVRRPGLAAPDARPAGGPLRRHPGHRLRVHARRPGRGAGGGAGPRRAAARPRRARRACACTPPSRRTPRWRRRASCSGIGQDGLRKMPVDDEFRMDPRALARAITEDRAAGLDALRGDGHRRHHLHHQHRPRAGDRGRVRARGPVAARGRRLRRQRGRGPGAALAARTAATAPTRWS